MFEWFSQTTDLSGLERMRSEFGAMLDNGRHCFDLAANCLLGGSDKEVIREDLFSTDKEINHAERQIRRELIVHSTVHGAARFPACLVLMSIVKDAERIGDYAKNLFDLVDEGGPMKEDAFRQDLIVVKDRISALLGSTRQAFEEQTGDQPREVMKEAAGLEDHCDAQVAALVGGSGDSGQSAMAALAYRYMKRVASHCSNVATSIVMPVDRLDYFDEDPRPALDEDPAP